MRSMASLAGVAARLTGGASGLALGRAVLAEAGCVAFRPAASSALEVVGLLLQLASTVTTSEASRAGKQARLVRAKKSGFKNMGKLNSEMGTRLVGQQCDASAVGGDVLVHDRQTNAAAADSIGGLAF